MKKERMFFLYGILISLVLVIIASLYMHYSITVKEQEFNMRLDSLVQENKKQMEEFDQSINDQMKVLQNVLTNLDEQNKGRDKDLLDLIAKVESESKQAVQEARSDLEKQLSSIETTSTDFSKVIQNSLKSVVSVLTDKGQGSGAIISRDREVVTNYHVIYGARVVNVLDYDKVIYKTKLVGYDIDHDIAVLEIVSNETFERLDFVDSDKVKVGESVVALGNPLGLAFTATQGIVSARRVGSDGNEYIQVDVPINPGNSGGPVIDASGNIIGIANFKISGAEGVGFAIPSNVVEEVVNNII